MPRIIPGVTDVGVQDREGLKGERITRNPLKAVRRPWRALRAQEAVLSGCTAKRMAERNNRCKCHSDEGMDPCTLVLLDQRVHT